VPRRIQLRRAKGWRKPAGAVVVARPSRWGNPFPFAPGTAVPDRATAVARFRELVTGDHDPAEYPSVAEIRRELAGRDLACWCPLDGPCHADVLLEIANG
jgi:hypothetical protein